MTDTTIEARRSTSASGAPTAFPVTAIALALIGVSVLVKAWAVAGSWYYEDDFYFLSAVARGENDLEWYLHRHNVHFMPLSFVLVTMAGSVGGFAWWPAALQILAMYTAGAVACWWMLRRIFGNTPRILIPLTFYVFSPFLIPAVTWWAVAINVVAAQAPLFVLMGAHVEYLRTRSRRWLVIAAIMLVLMSGFYVKSLVVLPVLGLFTLCYASTESRLHIRFWQVVRTWWPVWTLYTVVGLLVAAAYVYDGGADEAASDPVDLSGMFESLFLRNLVPGLLGGPWRWADLGGFPRSIAHPSDFAAALALVVLCAAIGWALYRWHNAWLPLVFLAPPVLVTFGALASLRSSTFSTLVGLEPKYWADLLPYAVLAIGVVAMPVLGLPTVRRRRDAAAAAVPAGLVVVVGAAYVVSSLTSTIPYVKPWHTVFPARQFVEGAVDKSREAEREAVVANVGAPAYVILPGLYPYNTPDYLFAPAPGTAKGVDAGVDLRMLDPFGDPQPARATSDSDTDVSDQDCITRSGTIDLAAETFDYPFWVTVTASFDQRTTVFVSAGRSGHTLEVPSGRHRLTFRTEGAYDAIAVSTGSGATMCPETVRIGTDLEVAP